MSRVSRRHFLRLLGTASALGAVGLPAFAAAKPKARVVIIGGGFGGATCAKYLRRFDPGIEVTLVEGSRTYVTCPFSNAVLGGLYTMDQITQSFVDVI